MLSRPGLEFARHGIARHAGDRLGHLAQRHAAARCAGDLDRGRRASRGRSALDFEQMRRDLERLLAHRDRGEMHRGAGGDGLPAGEAALAVAE